MSYQCPARSDFTNMSALNREFICILRTTPGLAGFDEAVQHRLALLGRRQIDWLAATPFLLYSLQEHDVHNWQQLLYADPNADLFDELTSGCPAMNDLAATTAGFLWQLAQQNPYSVRLISGASEPWCQLVGGVTYCELLNQVRRRDGLIVLRDADNRDLWRKLLDSGVSSDSRLRNAAQISALQTLLTTASMTQESDWRAAACAGNAPQLRVAEDSGKPRKQ